MPYFFVEGYQHDRPSDPLYIHADSEESAKARARELGMVVTGARRAKEEVIDETAVRRSLIFHDAIFFFTIFMPMISVFGVMAIDRDQMAKWGILMSMTSPFAGAFMMVFTMIRQQRSTFKMLVAEVKDLRSIIEQQQSAQRVEPVR